MTHFHAVLLDETGCEFGAGHDCETREEAYDYFREAYPESRVVQLESPEDTQRREKAIYDHLARGGDYDETGRPIFHHPPEDDEDDDNYCDLCFEHRDKCCCQDLEEDLEMGDEDETR